MKTHIIRLNSTVLHGVGGPEAGAMDLIYTFLLQKYDQYFYSYIGINQIGDDLNELIMKEPQKKIYINLRYPVYSDFETKSVKEKNRIRLDVVHTALVRIAEHDKKFDIKKLEAIRQEILDHDFSFDFVYKTHAYKKNKQLVAKIIICPEMHEFKIYVQLEEHDKIKCRQLIYRGGTDDYYFSALFYCGKWENENKFVISGKSPEVEFHVTIDTCTVELINKTKYEHPPFFQMMKSRLSKDDKSKAYKDWLHSLPPWASAIIGEHPN